jgi:hypothetical protein
MLKVATLSTIKQTLILKLGNCNKIQNGLLELAIYNVKID